MIAPAATMAPSPPPQGPTLRDIHLPPDPSWWPPAPGWWLLGAVALCMLLAAMWWWRRHRQALQRRRRLLAELDRSVARYRDDGDHAALAGGIQQLLRRVARQHEPLAARQRGEAWRLTLARMPLDAAALDALLALDRHIYQPGSFDPVAAVNAAREWLRLALRDRHWKRRGRVATGSAVEPPHV